MKEIRRRRDAGTPLGASRSQAFSGQIVARAAAPVPEMDGREFAQVEGYASVVDTPYEMYDFFGPYNEVIHRDAFSGTLAESPDVSFLVNHRGVTMARTTNGTLRLGSDATGLRALAYLNPQRQDVTDLVTAIRDGNITEMSFGFVIEDGTWNDACDTYTINRVSLHRGDVSAVNYGANPHTMVGARQQELLRELRYLPEGARRAAAAQLELRGASAVHHTKVVDQAWDGPAVIKACKTAAELHWVCAWQDTSGDKNAKSSYKFPHHTAGTGTPAVIAGVRNALARLSNSSIPAGDKAGVRAHLEAHMADWHKSHAGGSDSSGSSQNSQGWVTCRSCNPIETRSDNSSANVVQLAQAVDAAVDALGDAIESGNAGQINDMHTALSAVVDALLTKMGASDADAGYSEDDGNENSAAQGSPAFPLDASTGIVEPPSMSYMSLKLAQHLANL